MVGVCCAYAMSGDCSDASSLSYKFALVDIMIIPFVEFVKFFVVLSLRCMVLLFLHVLTMFE